MTPPRPKPSRPQAAPCEQCRQLRRGNTALIDALMDMVNQHCFPIASGVVSHGHLSANEGALALLEEAGFAEEVRPAIYALKWSTLDERKKADAE